MYKYYAKSESFLAFYERIFEKNEKKTVRRF